VQFPTIEFAYFFVGTATVAWAIRRHRTAQKWFLLLASYAFYAGWELRLLLLLVGASLGNWAVGEALARSRAPGARRAILVAGVLLNVGLLGTFKFYDFFRESYVSLAAFLGMSAHLPVLELFLPAGISFYTFQGIAYVVDTYRGKAVRPRTVLDFLLFMALFPQLLAGPICRSHELLPQIMDKAPDRIQAPSEAMTLIASGLFKKVVLSSYLATHMVEGAFQVPSNYSSLELLVAAYAYTAEIYLDFSGYTDMARGLGLLLGFRLPENFRYPYAATNIGEFWQRWHITFSRWLREYLYFPLGGSRGSAARTSFNLVVTFLVCGIWHGPRIGFIVWGLLHGVALAVYKLSVDFRRARGRDPKKATVSFWWAAAGCFTTVSFCVFVRIFFRTADLPTAMEYFQTLGQLTVDARGIGTGILLVTALGFGLNFFGRHIYEAFLHAHERVPSAARPLVWASIGLLALVLKTRDVAPYIYFGF
jgi:alginate O-acetyltransferase complex protein AlgI